MPRGIVLSIYKGCTELSAAGNICRTAQHVSPFPQPSSGCRVMSMAGSVAAEHHLWLILTEICEKEKVFLLDAPISQSGLFREAVSSVVEKFRYAKTQSAALKQFMPRRTRDHSTQSQSLPKKEPSGRSGAQAAHPSPTTVWGARGRSFPRQRPRRWVDLKRPNRPAASAPPSRS